MGVEKTLRVLKLQAEFDLADAARTLAEGMQQHTAKCQQVQHLADALDAARGELRRHIAAPQLNPAGYAWVRRMWHAGISELYIARDALRQAAQQVDEQRMALARPRQRESDLSRALKAEGCERRRAGVGRDQVAADDLWLQTQWSQK